MIKIRFDLHMHSIYSYYDAFSTPKQIVKMAVRKGLDGIAVTDHGNVLGGLKTMEYAKRMHPELKVIPGCEIKTKEGHILALDIKSWNNTKNLLSADEVSEKINDLGGISVVAHPFHSFWAKGILKKIDKFDSIEILNGKTSNDNNLMAKKLAEIVGLPGVAGSDAHFIDFIGCVYTICDGDVLEAIRKGRVSVGGNPIPLRDLMVSKIKRGILASTYLLKHPHTLREIMR